MCKLRAKDDIWYNNLTKSLDPYKVECKCGKKVVVLRNKKICSHCGIMYLKIKKKNLSTD